MNTKPSVYAAVIALLIVSATLLYSSVRFSNDQSREGASSQPAATLASVPSLPTPSTVTTSTKTNNGKSTLKTSTKVTYQGSSVSQSVAVSPNTVMGYNKITLPHGWSVIGIPFVRPAGSANFVPPIPTGLAVYTRTSDNTSWNKYTYDGANWSAPFALAPGEAAFVFNPDAVADAVYTFGEVPASASVSIPSGGYYLRSAPLPVSGSLTTNLNFPTLGGTFLWLWSSPYNQYYANVYDQSDFGGLEWSSGEPVMSDGQGFWVSEPSASTWTMSMPSGAIATGDLPANSYGFNPDGSWSITFVGSPSTSYAIESSTDLRNWSAVATTRSDQRGVLSYNDSAPGTKKFYRARSSPVVSNSATRTLPNTYTAGTAVNVSITVNPAPNTVVYSIEETPPTGWTVNPASISAGGSWDSPNGKVKWGPYFQSTGQTLTYTVTPPAGTSGTKTFTGVVAFDNLPQVNITGNTTISSQ